MRTQIKTVLKHIRKSDSKIYNILKNIDFDEWFGKHVFKNVKDKLFIALCREIVGQQLSGKAATTIFKRFIDCLKQKMLPLKCC